MKKLKALVAMALAAVLTLGTAVTAMAVTDPEVPTTQLRFNLGGANSGIMTAGLDNDTITLDGYRLLDVTATQLDGLEDYAYVYSLLESESNEPNPLTVIMVEALNQVLSRSGDNAVTAEDLIENLSQLKGDKPAKFAEAIWQGILANNSDNSKKKISADASFQVDSIEAAGTVQQGYWLFVEKRDDDDKPAAFLPILLDTLGKDKLTVNLKKDAPTIDKEVKDKDGNYGDSNTASIGDTVEFRVTSKVPNMTGYEKYFFVVTDTLSKGLSIDKGSFTPAITIGTGDDQITVTKCAHSDGEAHEKCYDLVITKEEDTGETTIKVVFKNFIQYADRYKPGTTTPITITYSATLNEKAVIGNAGNPNSVVLQYSNDPLNNQEGKPENPDEPDGPIGETPERETKTYVAGLQLKKVDENGKSLPNAEFTLSGTSVNKVIVTGTVFVEDNESGTYYKLTDGTYTTAGPTEDTKDSYADLNTKYTQKDNVVLSGKDGEGTSLDITAITNNSGIIEFKGLGEGIFEIEETRAPGGYNPLKEPIYVRTVWSSEATAWSALRCDAEGKTIENDNTVKVDNGTITLTVENRTGTELPGTGGIGTTIFYVAGVLLVLGAGAMLLRKKRGETK